MRLVSSDVGPEASRHLPVARGSRPAVSNSRPKHLHTCGSLNVFQPPWSQAESRNPLPAAEGRLSDVSAPRRSGHLCGVSCNELNNRRHAPLGRSVDKMTPILSDTAPPRTIEAADVTVRPSPGRGRGVFAGRRFAAGETIEVCPVIALSEADARKLDDTGLFHYYFGWGEGGKQAAIVLGYGSLYNHSPTPNAEHRKNAVDGTMSVVTVREIAAGEEIFIHYDTGIGGEQQPMWFEIR